jgi:hypothetical protein
MKISTDPGYCREEAFLKQEWVALVALHPAIGTKIAFFQFELARNVGKNSVRLPYYLSANHVCTGCEFTYKDWVAAIYGMADCYGELYDPVYQQAFQQIGNNIVREKAVIQYKTRFLEDTVLDTLYPYTNFFRDPLMAVLLPGHTVKITPKNMTPTLWAQALCTSFLGLIVSYRSITTYQTFHFYVAHREPHPLRLCSKAVRPNGGGEGMKRKGGGRNSGNGSADKRVSFHTPTPRKDSEENSGKPRKSYTGLCANSIMTDYGAVLKSGVDLAQCPKPCSRLHVKDYAPTQSRNQVVSIAHRFCKPVLDAFEFKKLCDKITADTRYK